MQFRFNKLPTALIVTLVTTALTQKRLALIVVVWLSWLGCASAATPTLVQSVHTGEEDNNQDSSTSTLKITLPNRSLASNLLVMGFQYYGVTVTGITDNKLNTWTKFSSSSNTDTAKLFDIWYTAGATAGTQVVTVQFSGSGSWIQGNISEWYNVATSSATDGGHATGDSTSSPYTAGSFSTTTAGDLILSYGFSFCCGSGTLATIVAGTAGSGFTLIGADVDAANNNYGTMAEYQVWSSSGSINPNFTTTGNTTAEWGVGAIAFKSASAGTAPTASPRIVAVQHQYLRLAPSALQFPCPAGGNLLVVMLNSINTTITALTDSAGNTWSFPASANVTDGSNQETAQIIYAANATTSPTLGRMTYTLSGGIGDPFIVLFSIVGAATSPFDIGTTASGNQATQANLTSVSITPSTSGGIVFSNLAVNYNDVLSASVSGQTALFDSVVDGSLDNGLSSASQLDEDNGNAHVYNTSTAGETFVWAGNGGYTGNTGFGPWSAAAAAFKAGGGALTAPGAPQNLHILP